MMKILAEAVKNLSEKLQATDIYRKFAIRMTVGCDSIHTLRKNVTHITQYITLVSVASESYDDKNDKTITEQSIYLQDNCPYGWGTLVKSGAKYMVIEKPKHL